MSVRPTDEDASRALQSLLAAAFTPTSQAQPSPAATDMSTPGHSASQALYNDATRRTQQVQATASGPSATRSSNSAEQQHQHDNQDDDNLFNALNSMSTSALVNSHSHTMALLANQPSLFPGLTLAPPSPASKSRNPSSQDANHNFQHGTGSAPTYKPQPTRSGRVPQKPDPTARREADRETMLFNDYFDWPSDDDEDDDPDFQPHAPWSDLVADPGTGNISNEDDDEGNDSDISDTFTPAQPQQTSDHFSVGTSMTTGASPFSSIGISSTSQYPFANAGMEQQSPRRRSSRVASSPLGTTSPASSPRRTSSRKTSSSSRIGTATDQRKNRPTLPTVTEHPTSENAWPLNNFAVLNSFLEAQGSTNNHAAASHLVSSSSSSTMHGPLTGSVSHVNLMPPLPPLDSSDNSGKQRQASTSGSTKRSASVLDTKKRQQSAEINLTSDGKRVRGRSKKYLDMSVEQQSELRKERNRESARQARIKKKMQNKEQDRYFTRLEEENVWLRERCRVLEDRLGEEHLRYESECEKQDDQRRGRARRASWSAASVADSIEDDEEEEESGQRSQALQQPTAASSSSSSAHRQRQQSRPVSSSINLNTTAATTSRDPLALLATSATAAATGGAEQMNALLGMSNVAPETLEGLRKLLLNLAERAETMISAPTGVAAGSN
ncbi:hypothetical protein ACM66B_005413 [Microbotryomycetes sp. NB124-2]